MVEEGDVARREESLRVARGVLECSSLSSTVKATLPVALVRKVSIKYQHQVPRRMILIQILTNSWFSQM